MGVGSEGVPHLVSDHFEPAGPVTLRPTTAVGIADMAPRGPRDVARLVGEEDPHVDGGESVVVPVLQHSVELEVAIPVPVGGVGGPPMVVDEDQVQSQIIEKDAADQIAQLPDLKIAPVGRDMLVVRFDPDGEETIGDASDRGRGKVPRGGAEVVGGGQMMGPHQVAFRADADVSVETIAVGTDAHCRVGVSDHLAAAVETGEIGQIGGFCQRQLQRGGRCGQGCRLTAVHRGGEGGDIELDILIGPRLPRSDEGAEQHHQRDAGGERIRTDRESAGPDEGDPRR